MKLITKYGLIFLVSLLLFPSAVKLAHFFANHEHTYCNHYSEGHFHEKNLDCELFKFQQAPISSAALFSYEFHIPDIENSKPVSAYIFLSDHQKLPFSLRGPPSLA
ncbi:hypothetical protein GCM10007103_11060 [Salinimicrobium marinum]|uniref:Uncharacterized protein n=1 Tax=Salinimicrobium marinum TaxID=680283 RepID=A0A918S971_9FLAO|nr:hypothetical protein [Salinimicrobium marinum]GHA31285.1 hypothetical protein GCM10007103_11060 [Salinimicrobium marinum]